MSFDLNTNNEYWIISYFFKNPEVWGDTKKDEFCHPTSVSICEALEKMYVSGIKAFNIDTLLNYLIEAKVEIEKDQLENIYNSYHDFANIEDAFKILKLDKIRKTINDELLEDLFDNTHTGLKTEEDIIHINGILTTIQEKISAISHRDKIIIDSKTLVTGHRKLLEGRKHQRRRSTGDTALDRLLVNPFAPGEQTTIFGQKSSGKSTYAQNIANALSLRKTPVLYLNLEMGKESWMDKAICMRTELSLDTIMHPSKDPSEQKKISDALDGLEGLEKFFMIEDPIISISDLERHISEVQRTVKEEYIVTFIDLTTMLQDFSSAIGTREIDKCVNRLNEIAKKTKTHIVNIVQENENRFRGNKINKVRSLKYFKPKITDIKDAASIAERSRVVLYVWNEFLMKQSFFPEEDNSNKDDEQIEEELAKAEKASKTLEIKVVKQNMGIVGGYAKYDFEAEYFRLKPTTEK